MSTSPILTKEEHLYNLKKDKKIFKKKNEKDIETLLIDDVYLKGTYNYNDYKEQLKNLKTISIEDAGTNKVVLKNFPVENLKFSSFFQYKNFRFINFYNLKECIMPEFSNSSAMQNLLDDLTSLEKVIIPQTLLDSILTLKNNVKTFIINSRYSIEDLKFNVENKNVKVYPDDNKYSYLNLHIYDDNSSITYSIYGYECKIAKIEYVYYDNSEEFDLSNLIDEYNVEEKKLGIGKCKKITCKKSNLERLKGNIELCSCDVDEIEIIDDDDMLINPRKITFKTEYYENIDNINIHDKENITITLVDKDYVYRKREILIRNFKIIDFDKDETIYFSDCQKIHLKNKYIPKNIKKLILDSYGHINYNDKVYLYKILDENYNGAKELVVKKDFDINNLDNVNVNFNYLTFEFGLKCENSITINTDDDDFIIKIVNQNNEEKVKLLKNTKYKIFSSDEMMIIEHKNDRYKFQDIITLKNDDLFHFTKKFKIKDRTIDLNINLEYLNKLDKLGIDRRIIYYSYYKYSDKKPFNILRKLLDELVDKKTTKEDMKKINDFGNMIVKKYRRHNINI